MRDINHLNDRSIRLVFDPIKITSPDQFVPLYLTDENKVVYTYDNYCQINIPYPNMQPADRKFMKKILTDQFNQPPITEYRFSIPIHLSNSISDYGSTTMINCFTGHRAALETGNVIAAFGLLVDGLSYYGYTPLKTTLYSTPGELRLPNIQHIRPLIMIMIKAKHLHMIKVRRHLRLPITMPLEDIQVWINECAINNGNSTVYAIEACNTYQTFKTKDVKIMYKSTTDMIAHLLRMPDSNKSLGDRLARAKSLLMADMEV